MKKVISVLLAASLALSLAACGQGSGEQPVPVQEPTPAAVEPAVEVQSEQPSFYAEIADNVNPYTGWEKTPDYPQGTRGVAVMVNNVQAALPQSGINGADLLYEMVTESGITRLMAVYRDYSKMPTVGPVRSARDQHVQLMLPLDCLYAHIGASTYAAEMLETFKYTGSKSIDGKYKNYYWIDSDRRATRAQEHCVYTDGEEFSAAVEKYAMDIALGNEPAPVFNWVPAENAPRSLEGGEARDLYIRFSSYAYSELVYSASTGKYAKYEFGGPQIDTADEGRTYEADNVFVLFAEMEKYPDGVLTKVDLSGQGAGLYLCGGRYEVVRWAKGRGEQPLRILDKEGHETDVSVNPGRSYTAVVDIEQLENLRIDGSTLENLGL